MAPDDQGSALSQTQQVNEPTVVLLSNFQAVSHSATPAQFGSGRHGGVSQDENCRRRRLGRADRFEQVARLVGNVGGFNAGDLKKFDHGRRAKV